MIFRKILLFFAFFITLPAFGQISTTADTTRLDTIFFLNGEVRAVKIVDTVYHLIRFLPEKRRKKPHVLDVEKDRVFSVKLSNGQEHLVYFHDTTVGNVFSVLEAKMFMLGEREADQHYRNKWPFIFGFSVGSASPLLFANALAFSPIAPAVTPLYTLIPYIKIDTTKISNKNYLQYDTYLMGYEKVARKKNFIHAMIGAGTGLGIGLGTMAIPDKTWKNKDIMIYHEKKINLIYAVWSAEVGTAIIVSVLAHLKHKRKKSDN